MSIIHPLLQKLQNDVQELQKGLQPDHLSFWYQKIISDTKEMAPPWLQDKINVKPVSYTHMTLPTILLV